jgi:hypothetical protein
VGLAAGILRTWLAYQPYIGNGAGDFFYAIRVARDLWNGIDPYQHYVGPDLVSYPLPAGIISMPFALFSDPLASGLFMGCSSFILAWCLLRNGKTWPLLMFLSWPFAYSVIFSQWAPLMTAIWFLPALLPLILVKPNIALPLIVTNKISKTGIVLTVVLLVVSLILYPRWPWIWLEQTKTYRGYPLLLSLPVGPLTLLALLKYKDRRAWLLFLFVLMPQRVVYDQLPLLLVATSGMELFFLVVCSWISLPILFASGGWGQVPVNWQFWVLLTLYMPAMLVLFRSDFVRLVKKRMQTFRNISAAQMNPKE